MTDQLPLIIPVRTPNATIPPVSRLQAALLEFSLQAAALCAGVSEGH
jgi:hypothetical protein